MQSLFAARYASISDRREEVDSLRRELSAIINAQPTQIRPEEREGYIDALLGDLEPQGDDAVWVSWPDDVYDLALSALKSLSRNPVGSTSLAAPRALEVLVHHAGLPNIRTPATSPSPSPSPSSPSRSASSPCAPSALEAMRTLANVLVLHPDGRDNFAALGGGRLVARALADDEIGTDRLFLLGRVGFLVTIQRAVTVRELVNSEGLVDSLVYFLFATPLLPANYDAFSEVLKLVGNVLSCFPDTDEPDAWDDRLDPLLWPLLCLLHSLNQTSPTPPLSHVLHALLHIPFSPALLPTWQAIPDPPSPTPSSSSVRALLNRVKLSSPPRKSASDSMSLHRKTPSPPPPLQQSSAPHRKQITLPTRRNDPRALPARVLHVVETFLETYYPFPKELDDEVKGLVVDEVLPPVLLVLVRAAAGCSEMRTWLRDTLLPKNLDRTNEAGPLESRRGVLGDLLRLMQCANHPSSRDTAGELLWAICDCNPTTMTKEIGYGNAAGLLFRKGLSGPPEATIEELPADEPDAESREQKQEQARHPITALKPTPEDSSPLSNMSDQEKEREAERLFVLFDRMEKNPIISARSGQGQGGSKSVKQAVRDEMERRARDGTGDSGDEAEEAQRQEEREEEEALRELEAYRRRTGAGGTGGR
nr:guanine nucleotide exchange factor [Naematelia aurantialba]